MPENFDKMHFFRRHHSCASLSFLSSLHERSLIYQCSHRPESMNIAGVYLGFDPTAPSLHLGHLPGILTLARAAQFGIKSYALVRKVAPSDK